MGRGSKVVQMGYLTPRGFRGSAPNGKNQLIFKNLPLDPEVLEPSRARAKSDCV